jgi:putative endonuclease
MDPRVKPKDPQLHYKIMKQPCVYILASKKNGTLYIGVTSQMAERLFQHQHGLIEGFTKTYNVKRLVYMEWHDRMETAIRREKSLKRWRRHWKIDLIEKFNPQWKPLNPLTGAIMDPRVKPEDDAIG